MKILIYGGTFNPIHLAHLKNIEWVGCCFDKVLVIPNKKGHFKVGDELASISDRLKMIELGLKQLPSNLNVEISGIEIISENSLYSYDVVRLLQKQYPQAQFSFLIGSDQAKDLNNWYKITELKEMVEFIVTKRDADYTSNEFKVFDNELLDYSSTAIRQEYVSSGIVAVDEYIRKEGLYLKSLVSNHLSEERLQHSNNVADLAVKMACKYQLDVKKAYIAGMLHDLCKEMPLEKQYELIKGDPTLFEVSDATVHAFSAYHYIKDELMITDEEILTAIKWHTTAYYQMSDLAKLIYTCDMLSLERDFKGIEELRLLLNKDLNECFKACFSASYEHLIIKGLKISEELIILKEMIERNEV